MILHMYIVCVTIYYCKVTILCASLIYANYVSQALVA